jgi:hypothetical protein
MKLIEITKGITISLSQNECGYEKVLDDFSNTKKISIATYNISNKESELINKIKKLKDVKIELITNIPNRWDEYYGDWYKSNASKTIRNYLRILSPESFDSDISIYFNFTNHSKITVTDNYAYIGSANFSIESSNNIEAGVLVSDTDAVKRIQEEFIPEIIRQSSEYFGVDILDEFMVLLSMFDSEIRDFDESFLSNIFNRYLSAKEGEKCFDIKQNKLHSGDFEKFQFNMNSFIDELNISAHSIKKYVNENTFEILGSIDRLICENKSMDEFVKFKEEHFSQEIFEDLLIHDTGENTDELLQESLESADYEKDRILFEAKQHLINLDDYIQVLSELVGDLIKSIIILIGIEEEIDNTL